MNFGQTIDTPGKEESNSNVLFSTFVLTSLLRDPSEFIDHITLITPKVALAISKIQGKQFFRQG